STTTGSTGQYVLSNLAAGSYRICEVLQAGWNRPYPGGSGCHQVTVTTGQNVDGRSGVTEPPNFGNWQRPVPGTISGFKWNDQNNNGQWNSGEPGLAGWTIFLDANGNGVLDT